MTLNRYWTVIFNHRKQGAKSPFVLTYFLFFSLGSILALGQAPFSLTYLSLTSLPVTAFLWQKLAKNPWHSFMLGGIWGIGYFSITMVWIVEPFLVGDKKYLASLAPFALLLVSLYLSLFWAIAFSMASYVGEKNKTREVLNLIIFLTLAEVIRSYIFGGFPWGLISYSLIDTPFYWLASICGPYFVLSVIYFIFFSIIISFRWLLFNLIFISVLVFMSGSFFVLEEISPLNSSNFQFKLVQPNIDQSEKWDPEKSKLFYNKYIKLGTEKPIADLVILPETAFATNSNTLLNFTKQLTSDLKNNVIVGVKRFNLIESKLYNSILFADSSGTLHTIYNKKHLVPFGEYIPFIDLFLAKKEGKIYGYSSGKNSEEISFLNMPTVLPVICYEIIFSARLGQRVKDAQWILNLTNDAWFGDFSGPQQHLVQARMRAIELGLPVVRVANTGITAIIKPDGTIVNNLNLNEEGSLNSGLPMKVSSTTYLSFGPTNWLILLISINLTVLFLINVKKILFR